jgi:hypothetical protein
MHGIAARLARVEKSMRALSARTGAAREDEELRRFAEAFPALTEWLLRYDDSPLVAAVIDRANVCDCHGWRAWYWLLSPYAKWATPPGRLDPPEAMLRFLADPPTTHWSAILACESCGLTVPRLTHESHDRQPFKTCPACGGRTSQSALYGPPGTEAYREGPK